MLLKKIVEISAILKCETGLRVGGSNDTLEIGGLDNPILRHPLTNAPYIPGSSLKGKIRSLLESVYGRKSFDSTSKKLMNQIKGLPCGCGQTECPVCRVFGAHQNTKHKLGPSRVLFRDAKLTEQSQALLDQASAEKGIHFSEVKTENTINRDIGTAFNPRPYERVPAGSEFQISITLKIYDTDREEEIIKLIRQGLHLLENDYLGSSGSRGYGKVSFHGVQINPIDVSALVNIDS